MPGAACPWKKTWSPGPPSSRPRKKWLKPTSYRLRAVAEGGRGASMPPAPAVGGGDGVDVEGLHQRRQPDLQLSRALEQLVDDEPGAIRPGLLDHRVERVEPLPGLGLIGVGQLLLEG